MRSKSKRQSTRGAQPTVCFAIGGLTSGGAELQFRHLVREISKTGVKCVILTHPVPVSEKSLRVPDDVEVRFLSSERLAGVTSLRARALRLSSTVRVFIVAWAQVRPVALCAWLYRSYALLIPLAWLLRVPIRVQGRRGLRWGANHSISHRLGNGIANLCSTHVICNSEALAEQVKSEPCLRAEKVSVIVNGVDIPPVAARVSGHPVRVITAANLSQHKGQADLLRALAMTNSSCLLDLVGSGNAEQELRALAQELGLTARVRFLGHVPDIMPLLLDSDIYVSSSLTESRSNSIIEAMAAGLPVVATDVGGSAELLGRDSRFLLVPARNPSAIAAAIDRLADDQDLRRQIGAANRGACAAWSWHTVMARYREVLVPQQR